MDWSVWTPDSILRLFLGGGWTIPALIALFIVCRWPPWRRREPKP